MILADLLLVLAFAGFLVIGFTRLAEDFADPMALFTIFYAPVFLLRPAMLLMGWSQPTHPFLFSLDVRMLARQGLIIFLVAYASFAFGYASAGSLSGYIAGVLPRRASRGLNVGRLRWLALLATGVSLGVTSVFLARAGSIAGFMYQARHGLFSGMFLFAKIPLFALYVVAFHYLALRRSGRRAALPLALAALLAGVFLLFADRGAVIYLLFTLFVGFHLAVRRATMRRLALVGGLSAALLVALGTARQAVFIGRDEGVVASLRDAAFDQAFGSVAGLADNLNLKSVDHFLVVVQDFGFDNYHRGRDYFVGLSGVVPRRLWAGKPRNISLGGWFRDRYMPGTGGKPFTAVGELWLNFGLLGVVVIVYLIGVAWRGVWLFVRTSSFAPGAVVFYLMLFLNVTGWGIPGSTTAMQVVYYVIPMVVALRLVHPKLHRPRLPAGEPVPASGHLSQ